VALTSKIHGVEAAAVDHLDEALARMPPPNTNTDQLRRKTPNLEHAAHAINIDGSAAWAFFQMALYLLNFSLG
jgi:hypothetical protein